MTAAIRRIDQQVPDRRRVGWTDGQMDGCHGQMEEEDGGGGWRRRETDEV